MIKKCFIITEFGKPFPWTQKYIENIGKLGADGWYWKIFTPNKYENVPDNVEIVDMTARDFAVLFEQKVGVKPNLYVTEYGVPSVHITDFYVASGLVCEDYLKGFDFWGITNMDVVYGKLSHFIPDSLLEHCDIFTDDIRAINGVFSLYRNTEEINKLFMKIPHWKEKFAQLPCLRCISGTGEHSLFGTDEFDMTEVVFGKDSTVRAIYPRNYFLHSHDRLENHAPEVKLDIKEDGSLWELYTDIGAPQWIHSRPLVGREIPYFHFLRTKEWPKCLQ